MNLYTFRRNRFRLKKFDSHGRIADTRRQGGDRDERYQYHQGMTLAHMALRWILDHDAVSVVIRGPY
ncbi:MAG: hypothetical protein CVV46_07990 [Spirochaetae bacterium HGW-Spirochaetae-2]|nr:MAG: hypothetical protein CVV46_07990 [Spirochaetae bacterium HGW-Spirochaetae-2]